MMVLAGPGSGKTSVIVERTAYMTGEGEYRRPLFLL
ncbi:MAG: UvrD-helicase domain-containing protein [Blautia faecis]